MGKLDSFEVFCGKNNSSAFLVEREKDFRNA